MKISRATPFVTGQIILTMIAALPARPAAAQQGGILFLESENDLYGDGKDRWFTNGLRLGYAFGHGEDAMPGRLLGRLLGAALPGAETSDGTDVYLALGQAMYTPVDIGSAAPIPGDRPFGGWLYGETGIRSEGTTLTQSLNVSLGVTGDPSLARRTQIFVHTITNSPEPKGWPNQLRFEPTLQFFYALERPIALSGGADAVQIHLTPSAAFGLGTVRLDAGAGLLFSVGTERPRFVPRSIGPGAGGATLGARNAGDISWYAYAGFDGRAVAHDFFLDGGTFRSGPDLDKRGFVYEAKAGLGIDIRGLVLAYSFIHRSREFRLQPSGQDYGALTLSVRF